MKPRKAAWALPIFLGRGKSKLVCWRRPGESEYVIVPACVLFLWNLIMMTNSSTRIIYNARVQARSARCSWAFTSVTACFWCCPSVLPTSEFIGSALQGLNWRLDRYQSINHLENHILKRVKEVSTSYNECWFNNQKIKCLYSDYT